MTLRMMRMIMMIVTTMHVEQNDIPVENDVVVFILSFLSLPPSVAL